MDAGIDQYKLRERYSNRSRFIIAKGLISPGIVIRNKKRVVVGFIAGLSVKTVHVPLNKQQILDAIPPATTSTHPPRYAVKLAYGNRDEPWIVAIYQL